MFRRGAVLLRIGELLGRFVRESRLGVVVGGDTGFLLQRAPDTVRGPRRGVRPAAPHRCHRGSG
ncbi:MAG: hypothetical protein OEQ13_09245, partial [Acidobacteriota bacterium]|nr:hypothetical protein [Acidobacteriota bacterium]